MTETAHSTTDPLSKRRRYRRLMFGFIAAGVVGFIGLSTLEFPVLAVAVYWGCFLGFLAVGKFSDVTVFDERDQSLERRASAKTIGVAAYALILGAPGFATLSETGVYDSPPMLEGALYALGGLFVVYAIAYTVVRYRS